MENTKNNTHHRVVDSDDFDLVKLRRDVAELDELRKASSPQEYNRAIDEWYGKFDSSHEYIWAVSENKFHGDYYPSYEELSVSYPDTAVPFLDKDQVNEEFITQEQRKWRQDGYLIVNNAIPADVCDEYVKLRRKLNLGNENFPNWTPYIQHKVIKEIFLNKHVSDQMTELMGENLGLHFNLSFFRSTERGWHQDDYLNPDNSFGRYCAIWAAVDDIPDDSGPFEFVPGSHRLKCVSRAHVNRFLASSVQFGVGMGADWGKYAAQFVNPAYFMAMIRGGFPIKKFMGKKGDIMIWHSKLIHRGSPMKNKAATRPTIIGHFSSVQSAYWFGRDIRRYNGAGYYWNFD